MTHKARWTPGRDAALATITVILIAGISVRFPQFASPGNLAETLDDTSILILLALGQMLVILTRSIDLSVAANLALCGMIAALFNRSFPEAGVAPAIALAVLVARPWVRSTGCWCGYCVYPPSS